MRPKRLSPTPIEGRSIAAVKPCLFRSFETLTTFLTTIRKEQNHQTDTPFAALDGCTAVSE